MPSPFAIYPETTGRPETFAVPEDVTSFSEQAAKVGRALFEVQPLTVAYRIGTDILERPGALGSLFSSAERQTRLVDNMFAQDRAREEAYDRRIKAVQAATGVQLENPERGGYRLSERELRAASQDGPIDPAENRRQRFEQEFNKARIGYPDKAAELAFGDIDEEARAIAKGAEADYEQARHDPNLSTASGLAMQLAGGMWGQRRDPLMVGSLFAGPTGAVGRNVAARIFSSGLFQGVFNAGVNALEQPAVQGWRDELGLRSGVVPAAENVGLAFLFGAIPGAVLRGIHEIPSALRPSVQRVLDGTPEAGDIDKAMQAARAALGEIDADMQPVQRAAIKVGEEMDAATKATRPPPAKDVSPELQDDLTTAALRQADDPVNQPSPEGTAAARDLEAMPPEVQDRVAAAEPTTQREAEMAASEALEDIGNRQSIATTRTRLDEEALPAPPPRVEGETLPAARSKDPLDKVPLARDDGSATMVSPQQAARAGERETKLAELIRECK